jgi:glycosyltransferase involved in cell wall biosynthesis
MSNPVVSIIVCNHNYGKYIGECLESASNQDYPNIQIVVVDDASTDDSVSKIKYYANKDSRIVPIFLGVCVGASEARNIGIRRVWDTSDYFMILDSDDMAHPNKTREMLQKIMVSPSIGGVYADYLILNEQTKNVVAEFKEPFDARVLQQRCIVSSAAIFSKEALDKSKELNSKGEPQYYDPNCHGPRTGVFIGSIEDFELHTRIVSNGFIYCHIPKILSTSRVHSENQSNLEKVNAAWSKTAEYLQQKALARQGKI